MKTKTLLILTYLLAFLGITSIMTGSTFALFSANLKGSKINEISSSQIVLSYEEGDTAIASGFMTDEYAMKNSNYYDFSINTVSNGDSMLDYYIYLEELEGNTISASKVRVYLSDENGNPLGKFKNIEKNIGNYCYDYNDKEIYDNTNVMYKKCDRNSVVDIKYIFDSVYINNVRDAQKVCKKYMYFDNEITTSIVDSSYCRYGDVYDTKVNYLSDLYSDLSLNNVIYKGEYKFINNKSYYDNIEGSSLKKFRLKVWVNDTDNKNIQEEVKDNTHIVKSNNEIFRFKVNVYIEQKPLSY